MLKHEETAWDASQDVLLAMITSLDQLQEPAAFWGWVDGITADRCKHLLSTSHKERQLPEDEEGSALLESVEDLEETLAPDKGLDNEETRRMILGLVDALPPEQRMTVLFYYYDEMTVKQIAEDHGHQRGHGEEPAERRAKVHRREHRRRGRDFRGDD